MSSLRGFSTVHNTEPCKQTLPGKPGGAAPTPASWQRRLVTRMFKVRRASPRAKKWTEIRSMDYLGPLSGYGTRHGSGTQLRELLVFQHVQLTEEPLSCSSVCEVPECWNVDPLWRVCWNPKPEDHNKPEKELHWRLEAENVGSTSARCCRRLQKRKERTFGLLQSINVCETVQRNPAIKTTACFATWTPTLWFVTLSSSEATLGFVCDMKRAPL